MTSDADDSAIRVSRGSGRMLCFPTRFVEEIGDFVTHHFVPQTNGQVVRGERSLLLRPHDSPEFPAEQSFSTTGLAAFASAAAGQQGVDVDVQQSHIQFLFPPSKSELVRNPAIPRFVHENGEGMIEYSGNVSAAEIISDVCLAFPGVRVLVVSPHTNELRQLLSHVRELTPSISIIDVSHGSRPDGFEVDNIDDDDLLKERQLVFSTISAAASLSETAGMDIAHFPIVLYTQAARASELIRRGLVFASNSRFRLFGLLSSNTGVSQDSSRQMIQVFGPRRQYIPTSGFERSFVGVCWVENKSGVRNLHKNKTHSFTSVHRVQECSSRNDLIARVARNLIDRDFDAVGCQQLSRWGDANETPQRPSVAVICGTAKQAARLAERLPDWTVFWPDLSPDCLTGLSSADVRSIRSSMCHQFTHSRVICPLDFLWQFLSVADPEFLVIGSGGHYAPRFPETWFRHRANTSRRRLIIDFDDVAHRVTGRQTSLRSAGFQRQMILTIERAASENALGYFAAERIFHECFRPAESRGVQDER